MAVRMAKGAPSLLLLLLFFLVSRGQKLVGASTPLTVGRKVIVT